MIEIELQCDEPARLGEALDVVVRVKCDALRLVNGIDLTLQGTTEAYSPSSSRVDSGPPFVDLRVRLADRGELEGVQEYLARFKVPEECLPSGSSGNLTVRYTLSCAVDIPWWFDRTESREVVVRPAVQPRPPRQAITKSAGGASPLFIELGLDDTTFAPGDTITGAFSLGNLGSRRLDGSTIALVGVSRAWRATGYSPENTVFRSLADAREGGVVSFTLPVPKDTVPSFDVDSASLAWEVVLTVDGHGQMVVVPVTIGTFAADGPGATVSLLRPLGSGDEEFGEKRWRRAWEAQGRAHGLALDPRALRLTGKLRDSVDVVVRPRGATLAATLRWERLGIGLSIKRRTRLHHGSVEPLDNGGEADPQQKWFADRFAVSGDDPAQTAPAITPELQGALLALEYVEVGDDGAEIGSSAPARDADALAQFLDAVTNFGAAILDAEDRVPPPTWMRSKSAAAKWRTFAATTGGRLHLGRMALLGAMIDGERLYIETEKRGAKIRARTKILLAIHPPLPTGLQPGAVGMYARTTALTEAVVSSARRAAAKRRPGGSEQALPAVWIRWTRTTMVLTIAKPLVNPAVLREPLGHMQALVRHLRGENARGPYR